MGALAGDAWGGVGACGEALVDGGAEEEVGGEALEGDWSSAGVLSLVAEGQVGH